MSDSSASSTDDEDEITETEERADRDEVADSTDLEKAETQRDAAAIRPAVLQKGRTRSSRRAKEEPHPPVGFWHWKMVSGVIATPDPS
jgi:hypothetical protein